MVLPSQLQVFAAHTGVLPRDVREKIIEQYAKTFSVTNLTWEYGFIHGIVSDKLIRLCAVKKPGLLVKRDQVNPISDQIILLVINELAAFEYFYQKFRNFRYPITHLCENISRVNLDVFEFICQNAIAPEEFHILDDLLEMAILNNRLDIVRFLYEKYLQEVDEINLDQDLFISLCESEYQEMIEYVFENMYLSRGNFQVFSYIIDNLAEFGKLEIILDMYEKFPQIPRPGCSVAAINNAAANGHLETIEYIWENIFRPLGETGCTADAIDNAAENGHLEIIKYIWENIFRPKCEADRRLCCTTFAIDKAATAGYLEIVEYIYENIFLPNNSQFYEICCTTDAIDNAATNDHLEMVKYIWEKIWKPTGQPGCTTEAIDNAAENENLEMVKYLYEEIWKPLGKRGCTIAAIDSANFNQDHEMIEYLRIHVRK